MTIVLTSSASCCGTYCHAYLPPAVHARAEVVGVASDHAVNHTVGFDLQVQHDDSFPDAPKLDSPPSYVRSVKSSATTTRHTFANSVERRLTLEDAIGKRLRWVLEPGCGVGNATNK